MADDKKPAEGGALPAPFHEDHFYDTLLFLLFLIIVGGIVLRIQSYLRSVDPAPVNNFWDFLAAFGRHVWTVWKGFAVAISVIALGWAVKSYRGLKAVEAAEELVFGMPLTTENAVSADKGNEKWAHVIKLINSGNPSDWRLAIIEADIMLDELLRANQYHGDTVGDMLKAVEPSDMLTLDAAWEAHKVRNRIAHSGADFDLNEREAKRVITLFESVFKEYEII